MIWKEVVVGVIFAVFWGGVWDGGDWENN